MKELRYTLLTDGSSDAALIPILTWLLIECGISCPIQSVWADLRGLSLPKYPKLADRIAFSLDMYPCDLLFVHRDAERVPYDERLDEILQAVEELNQRDRARSLPPAVSVIPVRMQETWLLFDREAIRQAAGNPSGRQALNLPSMKQLESLPDPKTTLHKLLKTACGLKGRRLHNFRVHQRARRVSEYIDEFSILRKLPAFSALETDILNIIQQGNWLEL